MRKPFSPIGNRRSSAVVDTQNNDFYQRVPYTLRTGVIEDVYTIDNKDGIPFGLYTLYTVRLAPAGQWIENVPAMEWGGHYNNNIQVPNFGPDNPDMQPPPADIQNCDENPYIVGQPVIIGFLSGSQMNPIILGPAPTPYMNSKQTKIAYPIRWGRHQGTEWSVDKDGNVEVDIKSGETLTIKVGGSVLCKISGGEVDLGSDSDTDLQSTIMGKYFKTYIEDTLIQMINSHTHLAGTLVAGSTPVTGVSGSPVSPTSNPPSNIYTTVAKVK